MRTLLLVDRADYEQWISELGFCRNLHQKWEQCTYNDQIFSSRAKHGVGGIQQADLSFFTRVKSAS
jgi:hypothetical protein